MNVLQDIRWYSIYTETHLLREQSANTVRKRACLPQMLWGDTLALLSALTLSSACRYLRGFWLKQRLGGPQPAPRRQLCTFIKDLQSVHLNFFKPGTEADFLTESLAWSPHHEDLNWLLYNGDICTENAIEWRNVYMYCRYAVRTVYITVVKAWDEILTRNLHHNKSCKSIPFISSCQAWKCNFFSIFLCDKYPKIY